MHSLGIVQWNSTRRDHPGNLGGVSGSGPVKGSNYKNYMINIKKNVKMKDRREYSMSVLGTHHTPKLSFLLDLKQELTLNRTHTRHNATNTKTVLPMLKNRGSIWTDSHCRCFARSSQNAYRYLTSGRLG